MAGLILTGLSLLAATVVIHAIGTTYWVRYLLRRYAAVDGQFRQRTRIGVLISSAIFLSCLHLAEVMLWALGYRIVLPAGELESLEAAFYFSAVTFTTLGYGDITLSSAWRLLSGIEAIDGILLIGWSTAFMFAILQRTWGSLNEHKG